MAHAQKADLVFQRNERVHLCFGSNTGWTVIRVKHEDYQQHKWARSFRWKTKSAFYGCAITFRVYSNTCTAYIVTCAEQLILLQWSRPLQQLILLALQMDHRNQLEHSYIITKLVSNRQNKTVVKDVAQKTLKFYFTNTSSITAVFSSATDV